MRCKLMDERYYGEIIRPNRAEKKPASGRFLSERGTLIRLQALQLYRVGAAHGDGRDRRGFRYIH